MRKPRKSYSHQRSLGRIIYYRRTASFWTDCLAFLDPILVAWPAGPVKTRLIDFFQNASTETFDNLVPVDRHLSPHHIAEHLFLAALKAQLEK